MHAKGHRTKPPQSDRDTSPKRQRGRSKSLAGASGLCGPLAGASGLCRRASRIGRRGRRGGAAVELFLFLPLLLALVLGMVEFSMVLSVRQQLAAASREGARVAALGGDPQTVEAAVRDVLGPGRLQAAQVQVVLTDSSGQPAGPGDPVAVAVSLPAGVAAPDLLAIIGVSFGNGVLVAETIMRKE